MATARRWPIEHWDRPPGRPEPGRASSRTTCCARSSASCSFPYARFDIAGVEHVPARGPVLLASNHRSYFDVAALALVARDIGRPVRFLGKKEIFDAPVVGSVARAIGGIPVDRGSGSGQPLRDAEAALKAGEVVIVLPQGTIPRGHDFFDPELRGKTGTARLAASTGATVVPSGSGGPRRSGRARARVPDFTLVRHPPTVQVRVGRAGTAVAYRRQGGHRDDHGRPSAPCCPAESRVRHEPTAEELARTKPPR